MFWAKEEEGEFHTLFGLRKVTNKYFFKYFRMGISKFDDFKELVPTDNHNKNTQWRRSTTTE
jgi:hypothetical protein